ncbi:MAG: TRAP transporter TatT component family protein, partial [Pseudomonadota bacterium]|nr:TRAP transporter TatT component family protein [Pseudomonadota bacterium]
MSTSHGISTGLRNLFIAATCLASAGCTVIVSNAADSFADNLSAAVLNQNDPELVRDGAPSYLLLLDSLLEGSPENPAILSAAATLYATYGSVFADDPERAARLTERARSYSTKA